MEEEEEGLLGAGDKELLDTDVEEVLTPEEADEAKGREDCIAVEVKERRVRAAELNDQAARVAGMAEQAARVAEQAAGSREQVTESEADEAKGREDCIAVEVKERRVRAAGLRLVGSARDEIGNAVDVADKL